MTTPETTDARRRIALNLSALRLRCQWTVTELAHRAGLTPDDIERIESAADPVPIDTLAALAAALAVPILRLLDPDTTQTH